MENEEELKRPLPNVNIIDNTKEEVLNYYINNSKVIDKKKKEKGEVFTPVLLVQEMLDKLPDDVWSNPNLKLLDPAVGTGVFPICLYYRFMEGLKDEIKDENDRREHILKNLSLIHI